MLCSSRGSPWLFLGGVAWRGMVWHGVAWRGGRLSELGAQPRPYALKDGPVSYPGSSSGEGRGGVEETPARGDWAVSGLVNSLSQAWPAGGAVAARLL